MYKTCVKLLWENIHENDPSHQQSQNTHAGSKNHTLAFKGAILKESQNSLPK